MKIDLELSAWERETLFQLSVNHRWRDVRLKARGLLLLGEGLLPRSIAEQCGVSHQTIYNWRHIWSEKGLAGLLGGHAGGRRPKLTTAWLETVKTLARQEALSLKELAQRAEALHGESFPCSLGRLAEALKAHAFSFKRTRMSLKKTVTPSDSPPSSMSWPA